MYKKAALLFLYADTPLHSGSGTSITDLDLPIQREVHTDLPLHNGSGLKGVFRKEKADLDGLPDLKRAVQTLEAQADDLKKNGQGESKDDDLVVKNAELEAARSVLQQARGPLEAIFGPDTNRADEHSGSLAFCDAGILLFPVRSLAGTFAWITCPLVLSRLHRDLRKVVYQPPGAAQQPEGGEEEEGKSKTDPPSIEEVTKALQYIAATNLLAVTDPQNSSDLALVATNSPLLAWNNQIVLEDLTFVKSNQEEAAKGVRVIGRWLAAYALPNDEAYTYWQTRLPSALVVVSDEVFRDFTRFSTEVVSRIRIGETGTVVEGALWVEENLPADCLLWGLTLATKPRVSNSGVKDADDVLKVMAELLNQVPALQVGGNETIGRGFVQATLRRTEDMRPTLAA